MKRMISSSTNQMTQKDIEAFLIDYMLDNDYSIEDQPLRTTLIRLMDLRHHFTINDVKDVIYEEGVTLPKALDILESQI